MKMEQSKKNFKIGDVLVFKGNITGDPHFDNFRIGESYAVQDIDIMYDSDICTGNDNRYVIFHDTNYGAIYTKALDCFDLES